MMSIVQDGKKRATGGTLMTTGPLQLQQTPGGTQLCGGGQSTVATTHPCSASGVCERDTKTTGDRYDRNKSSTRSRCRC